MKLILLGAPGAGKGTQAEILSAKLNIPTISTGNILRAAVKNETPVGLKAKAFMEAGALVPDEVIIGIMQERLAEADCANGYILDGMPRTIAQAEALEASGVTIDTVLSLEVEDEVIVERLAGRRECKACGTPYHIKTKPVPSTGKCTCGGEIIQRDDDNEETIRNRIAVYHEQTEPIKAYYEAQGKVVSVDSSHTVEETNKAVKEALGL